MIPEQMPAPMTPQPPMGGQEMPSPEGGAPGGAEMKPMLIKVLTKAKQMADQAGLDFDELVAEVSGGSDEEAMPAEAPAPRSPSPASMPM